MRRGPCLRRLDRIAGFLAGRVEVGRDGTVREVALLSDTLVCRADDAAQAEQARRVFRARLGELRFPALEEPGWAILPVTLPVAG